MEEEECRRDVALSLPHGGEADESSGEREMATCPDLLLCSWSSTNRNNRPALLTISGGDRLVDSSNEWVDTDGCSACELVEGRREVRKGRVELVEEDEVCGK